MKMTLLQLTQSILSSLDSDEVNSISDTTEALQVAEIVKQTYFNIAARADLPEHYEIFQLDASTDPSIPVIMYKPSNVDNIKWLKYYDESVTTNDGNSYIHDLNTDISGSPSAPNSPDLNYKWIDVLTVNEFMNKVNQFNPYETEVESYTLNGITLRYKNNRQPQYCCVLADFYILFDSFDGTIENTLQNSKTQCFGQIIPSWEVVDSFIPLLDDYQFPLLLNEAKSLAFFELKQSPHQKAEQEAKRQWGSIQKDKSVVNKPSYFDQLPNYGRR